MIYYCLPKEFKAVLISHDALYMDRFDWSFTIQVNQHNPWCVNPWLVVLVTTLLVLSCNISRCLLGNTSKTIRISNPVFSVYSKHYLGHVKRIWYLSPMRAAKVQASLRIRAISPEPPLLAHTSNESRGTFRQKARSLAPLNGWAYAVKIFHDGMLDDTNSFDAAHLVQLLFFF